MPARKLYTGPKGGKYYKSKGRKVYLKSGQTSAPSRRRLRPCGSLSLGYCSRRPSCKRANKTCYTMSAYKRYLAGRK